MGREKERGDRREKGRKREGGREKRVRRKRGGKEERVRVREGEREGGEGKGVFYNKTLRSN